MNETDEVAAADPRTPAEVWSAVNYIGHETTYVLARKARTDEQPDTDQSEGVVRLTPSGSQVTDDSITITLRAKSRLEEGHTVIFEESAYMGLGEPMKLSEEEVKEFAAKYILPFLMPYVEAGFERLCKTVDGTPAHFPVFVIAGKVMAASDTPDDDNIEDAEESSVTDGATQQEARHRR